MRVYIRIKYVYEVLMESNYVKSKDETKLQIQD